MEKKFKFFEQIARLGSIRQAAEHLHTSASSISRLIVKMEHEYGTALLVRHADGVSLTPAGEVVAIFAQSQSRALKQLQASIDGLTHLQKGKVTIFTVETPIAGLLPNVLARFSRDFPGIDYEIRIAGTDNVMRAVAENRCDLGVSYNPYPRPEVETIFTIRQPLLAVVAPGHHLAGRGHIDLADLANEPVGIPDKSFGIRHQVDCAVKDDQVRINIRLETNSIEMVRQFAIQGMGVAFLPVFSFEREAQSGSLVGIPLTHPDLSASTLQICKRRDVELIQPAARLVDYLMDAADHEPGVAYSATLRG